MPPNAANGPWTFVTSDLEPSTCTATVFPVSTTTLVPTGEFVVEVSRIKVTHNNVKADHVSRRTGKVAVSGYSPQMRA